MKSHPQPVTSKRSQQKGLGQAVGKAPKFPPLGDGDARALAPSPVDPVKRHVLIAQAAYYRAEKRGFAVGGELQDWLEAEAEIGQLLGQ